MTRAAKPVHGDQTMFELKPMSRDNVGAALEKAERYRLLSEPWETDSICRDILAVDPDNEAALKLLLLALTDRFDPDEDVDVDEARALLPKLRSEYDRAFYAGIICERKGKTLFAHAPIEAGPAVFRWLRQAMTHFEHAEELRTSEADDALLRWNACARMIDRHKHVRPPPGPPSGEWRIRDFTAS
jgi:hypothetical protein